MGIALYLPVEWSHSIPGDVPLINKVLNTYIIAIATKLKAFYQTHTVLVVSKVDIEKVIVNIKLIAILSSEKLRSAITSIRTIGTN